jgi:hypothetical protein
MDPMSIAMMASSSLGNLFSGLFGASAARAKAKSYEYAAQQALAEGGVQAQQAITRGNAVEADAAVTAAANGGGLVGSSMGVISNLAQTAMFNARVASYRSQTEARNDIYNAKVQKQNATNQTIGAVVGAVSPIVGGAFEKSARDSQLQSLQTLHGLGQSSPYDGMQ